jgi:hypothetical protein
MPTQKKSQVIPVVGQQCFSKWKDQKAVVHRSKAVITDRPRCPAAPLPRCSPLYLLRFCPSREPAPQAILPAGRSAARGERMADSGLETERRRAALKHASEAHSILTGLQHNWRLMGVTRPAARELDPIIATALKAVMALTDPTADHRSVAGLLRSVVEALDGMAQPGLDASREEAKRALARDQAQRAYQEIVAHRASGAVRRDRRS